MSHFSEVKTRLKDTNTLKKVLKSAGYSIVEGGVDVRGFMGDIQKADFKILTRTHYDIGFKKGIDGNYELIGDWELMPKVADIEQESFTKWLKREYARESILTTAKEQGYEIEEIQEDETGQIQLVVKKW